MTPISEKTLQLLDNVERFAQRKFQFRSQVSALIEIARARQQEKVLEDIIFLAKFLRNAHALIQRIGPAGEGYPKLSTEFQESLEKFSTLLKTIVKESPEDVKNSFRQLFFSLSRQSLENLIQFSADLSWIKNYTIDMKQGIF